MKYLIIPILIFFSVCNNANGQSKHRFNLTDITLADTSYVKDVYFYGYDEGYDLTILKNCKLVEELYIYFLNQRFIDFKFINQPKLIHLSLERCKFKKIPKEIIQIPNLKILEMYNNLIDTVAGYVFEHKKIQGLNIGVQEKGSGGMVLLSPKSTNTVLTTMNLESNKLTIPSNFFAFFPQLEALRLSSCYLTQFPESLLSSTLLNSLLISNNLLEELPENIGNLQFLSYLDISNNPLKKLPEGIGKLNSLTYLNLSNTNIMSLPESIGKVSPLTYLNLNNTKITTLPEGIFQLKNLQLLDMRGCPAYTSIEEKLKFVEKIQQAEMHPDLQIYW